MNELQTLVKRYLETLDDDEVMTSEGTCREIAEEEISLFANWLMQETLGMDTMH